MKPCRLVCFCGKFDILHSFPWIDSFSVPSHVKFSKLYFPTKSSVSVGFHPYLHRFLLCNFFNVFLHQWLFPLPHFIGVGRLNLSSCAPPPPRNTHVLMPRICECYVIWHRYFAVVMNAADLEKERFSWIILVDTTKVQGL